MIRNNDNKIEQEINNKICINCKHHYLYGIHFPSHMCMARTINSIGISKIDGKPIFRTPELCVDILMWFKESDFCHYFEHKEKKLSFFERMKLDLLKINKGKLTINRWSE